MMAGKMKIIGVAWQRDVEMMDELMTMGRHCLHESVEILI